MLFLVVLLVCHVTMTGQQTQPIQIKTINTTTDTTVTHSATTTVPSSSTNEQSTKEDTVTGQSSHVSTTISQPITTSDQNPTNKHTPSSSSVANSSVTLETSPEAPTNDADPNWMLIVLLVGGISAALQALLIAVLVWRICRVNADTKALLRADPNQVLPRTRSTPDQNTDESATDPKNKDKDSTVPADSSQTNSQGSEPKNQETQK